MVIPSYAYNILHLSGYLHPSNEYGSARIPTQSTKSRLYVLYLWFHLHQHGNMPITHRTLGKLLCRRCLLEPEYLYPSSYTSLVIAELVVPELSHIHICTNTETEYRVNPGKVNQHLISPSTTGTYKYLNVSFLYRF